MTASRTGSNTRGYTMAPGTDPLTVLADTSLLHDLLPGYSECNLNNDTDLWRTNYDAAYAPICYCTDDQVCNGCGDCACVHDKTCAVR